MSRLLRSVILVAFDLVLLILLSNGQGALSVKPLLDLENDFPYLINNRTGQVIEPRDYMDFDNLYTPSEFYKRQQTAQGRNYHMLKAFDFANYFQSDYWHYSSEEELRQSAQPVADESRCGQHLDWLESKLNLSGALFGRGQQHVNLMTLVDSFGRPEANTYFGHGYWLGSHYECTHTSLDMAKFEEEQHCQEAGCEPATNGSNNNSSSAGILNTRYCIGKARDVDWPSETEDNYQPRISYKVGLCLPEACETLSFGPHRAQIERLMRFNLPEYMKARVDLHELYCLPDSRSPIRAFNTSARVYLSLCGAWLLVLLAASLLYSCYRRHQRDLERIMSEQARRDLEISGQMETRLKLEEGLATNGSDHSSEPLPAFTSFIPIEVIDQEGSTSITAKSMLASGAKLLIQSSFSVGEPAHHQQAGQEDKQSNSSHRSSASSLPSWLDESPKLIRVLQALSICENMREFQRPPLLLRQPDASKRVRINLNALDAIKCLCCVLVIFGHTVFIHMQHLSNIVHTIELSNDLLPRFLIGFFNFVDTFFIISGMLTAYFIFKRFDKNRFANPLVWLSISLLRLLRLMPVYVLMFWFTKTITVHLSEGPIWDYGTDRRSLKGLCANDHWWKSIIYLGNWGTMQPLCILPAWSIIVDSQYSLVMPPLLFLILRHKRLGYLSLLLAILVSTANMSYQLATQTAVKTSDMAKVRLHVYPLISRFAAEFYNTAWNRIGPVAIGILGGHMLYLYDIGHIRQWPWFMRGTAFKFVLFLHLLIFTLPAIGRFTDSPDSSQETDLTIFVLSNATLKPVWSLINTIFILRLITDLRTESTLARLMSHNIWHCLGKLCFASYLIHYEVILVLLKSRQDGLLDPNWANVGREFSVAFLISTAIAYFLYILYEAPINKLITLVSTKPNYLNKHDKGADSVQFKQEGHDQTTPVKRPNLFVV